MLKKKAMPEAARAGHESRARKSGKKKEGHVGASEGTCHWFRRFHATICGKS